MIACQRAVILMLISLGLAAGCGRVEQAATSPVEGTVTFQGKPVAGASVMFMGKGPMAHGDTDAQGHFKLMTNRPGDGAAPGDYNVSISKVGSEISNPTAPVQEQVLKNELPAKYSDMSAPLLTAKVEAGKKNEFKFDLTE
jgi:hypothetical protein